jgi:MFS family permease
MAVSRLPAVFAAFRHPNFRLWFFGQLISVIGTWMQSTAQGYLVYELTESPAYLGYVGFALGAPSWLFTLYGGVIADRISRRRLLLITQTGMMLLAFILGFLVFTNSVQPWHILLLAFLLGVGFAFDNPARQAFVVEMVGQEDLRNAIALNSATWNSGLVIGPAIGSLVYALVGPGWCFVINGITFLSVIGALLMMKMKPFVPVPRSKSVLSDIRDGLRYVRSESMIILLMLSMAVTSLFGLGYVTLLPAWAVNVLDGDVRTNGFLLSARGAGALIGALILASTGNRRNTGKMWTWGSFIFPVALLIFSMARWLPLSFALLTCAGWGFIVLVNASNAMLQARVPDDLRGRVMSVFSLMLIGGLPLSSLMVGTMAGIIGEPTTLFLCGLVLLFFAVYIWLFQPTLRKSK